MESINFIIPKELENLSLPDPELLHEYEDETARRIYLEGPIATEEDPTSENSIGIVKRILRYNREDNEKHIPIEERKPIKIYIDSPGGDVTSTLTLINVMLSSKTPIYTINMCGAFSAAGIILACGHKRFGMRGSSVLIHSGSTYIGGTREQSESATKHFDKIYKKMTETLFSRTNIDQKTYKQKAPKDWYLDEDDCLKYGVIDQIVTDLDDIL